MLTDMADTRPDDAARDQDPRDQEDDAWAQLGDWLRDVREARGWTLDEVGARAPGRSVSSRLRQIERNYHPYGKPQTGTLRRIELGLWLRAGRLGTVLELAGRGLALPDPFGEPVVQPAPTSTVHPAASTSRTARRALQAGAHRAPEGQRQAAANTG